MSDTMTEEDDRLSFLEEWGNLPPSERLSDFRAKLFDECAEIARKKGADYTNDNTDDPLANMALAKHLEVVPTVAHSILVRYLDKVMRMVTLTNRPPMVEETARDTVRDAINYAVYWLWEMEQREEVE